MILRLSNMRWSNTFEILENVQTLNQLLSAGSQRQP